MNLAERGYAGKVLNVDLTEERLTTEPLNEEAAFLLLGGKGYGVWLLYKNTPKAVNPLSPQNLLVYATGPLTGTIAPTSSRFCIVTKSPATGTVNDSHCGGYFGAALKYSGFDAVAIKGSAESPSILVIDNGNCELQPAKDLWGLTTFEAQSALGKRLGDGYSFAVIGPAGERVAPIAGVFSGTRCAGRGGCGAVMGAKRLKAVAVRGRGSVHVHDPSGFRESVWVAHRTLRMNEVTVRSLPRNGTANILETINETGALPTRNFQTGRFKEAYELSGERFRETLWRKDFSCSLGCPIACCKIANLEIPDAGEVTVDGPDYETIFSLGSNCGVSDRKAITYANYLCDLYGIDTISTGDIIAFIMELYEKNMVSPKDLDGVEATWGNQEALLKLTEAIGKGEGIGKILEKGVRSLSAGFPGSTRYAMHVKGLELPAYEPRAAQGMGLCYAVSERGGCHLRAYTAGSELCGYGGGANPFSYDRVKVQLAIDKQDEKAVVDSAVLCFFTLFGMKLKEVWQMMVPCTGFKYENVEALKRLGARIITLTRMFNTREGLGKGDDTLPRRLLEEPLPEGPADGSIVRLEEMLSAYYSLRGWSKEGMPLEETVDELDLTQLVSKTY